MPLDVAAEAGLLTSFLGGVVLFSVGHQPVCTGMLHRILSIRLSRPARVQLLEDFASRLLAVIAFGVVLRAPSDVRRCFASVLVQCEFAILN